MLLDLSYHCLRKLLVQEEVGDEVGAQGTEDGLGLIDTAGHGHEGVGHAQLLEADAEDTVVEGRANLAALEREMAGDDVAHSAERVYIRPRWPRPGRRFGRAPVVARRCPHTATVRRFQSIGHWFGDRVGQ